ncbi:MAG: hypothetical protein H0V37_10995 [Chloroflexia bacterium]|nr:hypothetical protein [Chloroflexia bacterium]
MNDRDDDYIDIRPWPPIELAGQLVAHVTLGRRGLIENDEEAHVFEHETDRFELDAWAKLELTAWLAADDTPILAAPIGNLTDSQAEHCDDALIVASTIGWAIHVVTFPSLPLATDGGAEQLVLDWAPGPWTPVRNVVKAIRVRTDEALATERERWELVVWRCTLFEDEETTEVDREALRETIAELPDQGLITTDGGDFIIEDGTPFGELSADELDQLAHEAELRLKTLNWVCGFGDAPQSAPLFLDD